MKILSRQDLPFEETQCQKHLAMISLQIILLPNLALSQLFALFLHAIIDNLLQLFATNGSG